MSHKLIITADDYGMCQSVNRAIDECIKAKVVLSTNVMTNMEYAGEDSDFILNCYRKHLNFIHTIIFWALLLKIQQLVSPDITGSIFMIPERWQKVLSVY